MRISFLCVLNYGAGWQAQKSKRVKDWEITNSSHFWLVWKSKDNYVFSIVVCLSLLYYPITHFQNKYRKMILSSSLQLRLHNSPMKIYSTTRVYYMLLTFCYEELASMFTSEGGKLLTKERLRHAFNFANFSWMGIWVFLEVFEKTSPGTKVWCLLPYYSLLGSCTPQNWINLCYTTLLQNTTADPTQV